MKIGVLEWICGGGMSSTPAQEIPSTLRAEGRAMLSTLIQTLENAGAEVASTIDPRLVATAFGVKEPVAIPQSVPLINDLVPCPWVELAMQCDFSIVVAPEIDGTLPSVLRIMRRSGARLLNCEGEFLTNACDKRHSASCFMATGIQHPPTYTLDLTEGNPLELSDASRWVIKPYDGAGCEALEVVDRDVLQSLISHGRETKLLAQPLLDGEALSCSAIVDCEGTAWWMPLVTQELASKLKYRGGRVVNSLFAKRPTQLLDRTIEALGKGALGWVGVDLLYDSENEAWSVIEINPRVTTSIIGLTASSGDRLGGQLCEAFQGAISTRIDRWQDVRFSADGVVTEE